MKYRIILLSICIFMPVLVANDVSAEPITEEIWLAMTKMDVILVMADGTEQVGILAHSEGSSVVIVKADGKIEVLKKSAVQELKGIPIAEGTGHDNMIKYIEQSKRIKALELISERYFGMYLGFGPGIIGVDFEKEKFHSYFSGTLIMPLVTEGGTSAFNLGIGGTYKIGRMNIWSFDIFGHLNLMYTDLDSNCINEKCNRNMVYALGVGVGFHLTTIKGLIISFKIPVLGLSFGRMVNDLPTSVEDYYLSSAISMPGIVFGYRLRSKNKN
ncbi:MAG: hypothetical protein PVI26_11555 [Chitinispirillia bacterium]|jgi:hypothetical protein